MSTRQHAKGLLYAALTLGVAVVLLACQSGFAHGATDPAATGARGATMPAAPAATRCSAEPVLPQLTAVQPSQAAPGDQLKLTGSGGYYQDNCGSIDESAPTFPLFRVLDCGPDTQRGVTGSPVQKYNAQPPCPNDAAAQLKQHQDRQLCK